MKFLESLGRLLFGGTPLRILCCTCNTRYSLTKSRLTKQPHITLVKKGQPVETDYVFITCPSCDAIHALVFLSMTPDTKEIIVSKR